MANILEIIFFFKFQNLNENKSDLNTGVKMKRFKHDGNVEAMGEKYDNNDNNFFYLHIFPSDCNQTTVWLITFIR